MEKELFNLHQIKKFFIHAGCVFSNKVCRYNYTTVTMLKADTAPIQTGEGRQMQRDFSTEGHLLQEETSGQRTGSPWSSCLGLYRAKML